MEKTKILSAVSKAVMDVYWKMKTRALRTVLGEKGFSALLKRQGEAHRERQAANAAKKAEIVAQLESRMESSGLVPEGILMQVNNLNPEEKWDFLWGFTQLDQELVSLMKRKELADDDSKIAAFISRLGYRAESPKVQKLLEIVYRNGIRFAKEGRLSVEENSQN